MTSNDDFRTDAQPSDRLSADESLADEVTADEEFTEQGFAEQDPERNVAGGSGGQFQDDQAHSAEFQDDQAHGAAFQDDQAHRAEAGSYVTTTAAPADAPPRTLSRPKGPSWGTVALGLICLVVAGGAFWIDWSDLTLDWTRSGPLTLVGLGLILVLVGLAALTRRRDEDDTA